MIYFRGCVVRDKLPRIGKATEAILDKAGINYSVLDSEGCCGSFLLRTGFKEDALEVMRKNLLDIKDEKIVVSCAGCYNTLKNDYKELLGVELDVIHTSQLFRDLIKEGKLKPEKTDLKIFYHDPCHLGRHCGEYQAPREVIEKVAWLVDSEREKENSRCCGAGGGVKSAYPETALKLARRRIQDFEKTPADMLVTTCSFCILNLSSSDNNDYIKIMDLSELLLRGLSHETI